MSYFYPNADEPSFVSTTGEPGTWEPLCPECLMSMECRAPSWECIDEPFTHPRLILFAEDYPDADDDPRARIADA